MSRWPAAQLGNVAKVIRGVTFSKSEVSSCPTENFLPVLRAGNIGDKLELDSSLVFVSDEKISKHQLLRKNDIVMCTSSGSPHIVGKSALLQTNWKGSFGAFCAGIRANEIECTSHFLSHVLRSKQFRRWTQRSSGVNIKNIRSSELKEYEIPLPPLAEQKRIAAILDKADDLSRKRKRAIALADDFLRSLFLEMFGDPATNPKNWPHKRLGNLATKFSDGPFGSNLKSSHYEDAGVRVVRLQNIGLGEFIDRDRAYISEAHFHSLQKHKCLPGDVLVGTLGDPNLRACLLPDHIGLALNKADCVQIRPDQTKTNANFIEALLNQRGTFKLAQHLLHGQTRVRISMGTLRELDVPVPSLDLQRRYASIVKKTRSFQMRLADGSDQFSGLSNELCSNLLRN